MKKHLTTIWMLTAVLTITHSLAGLASLDFARDRSLDSARGTSFDAAPHGSLVSAQDRPFDAAQGRPFDFASAQDKSLDAAQGRPFDAAQDRQDAAARAAQVLTDARQALGGEEKLRAVKTLQATGDFRRSMGEMQMDGEMDVLLETPNKLRRNEAMNLPNGATAVRTEVLNGTEVWDDSSTRGGMGGGMRIVMRGPGDDQDPERMKELQRRMRRMDLARLTLAWLLTTDAPVTHAGVAEATDGKADVLEITPAEGPGMRLFIDQQRHMPLMLSWRGPQPRVVVRRGPGGSAGHGGSGHSGSPPADAGRMAREVAAEARHAPEVTIEMRFAEYKTVDGIQLPHVISQGMNGETSEEWTIKSYKVNPSFKASTFTK